MRMTHHRMLAFLATAAGGLLATAARAQTAPAAPPAILDQIPASAAAAVIIPNVHTLSTKVSTLTGRLGLPLPPDIVGFMLRNLGVTKGFDATGAAAAIYINNSGALQIPGAMPPGLLLAPASDPAGLLSTFAPGPADSAGIMEITLAQDTAEKAYAAVISGPAAKWVAIGESREVLSAYLKARSGAIIKSLQPDELKLFADNEMVGWINGGAIGKELLQQIEDSEEDVTGRMDLTTMSMERDPVIAAFLKECVVLGYSSVKAAVRDLDVGFVTFKFSEQGVTVGCIANFKAGSAVTRLTSAKAPQPTLAGLPVAGAPGANGGTPGMLLAGADGWDGKIAGELFEQGVAQILADNVLANDPRAAAVRQVAGLYSRVLNGTSGARFVLLDAPPGAHGGVVNGVFLLDSTDPAGAAGTLIQSFSADATKAAWDIGNGIHTVITVAPDAVTVKDLKLTKIHMDFQARPADPAAGGTGAAAAGAQDEAKAILAAAGKLFGTDGLTLYVAAAGQRVMVIVGADPGTLEAAVTAATDDAPGDKLSAIPVISGATHELSEKPQGVAYAATGRTLVVLAQLLGADLGGGRNGGGGGGGPNGRGRGRGRGRAGGNGPGGAAPPQEPASAIAVWNSGNQQRVEIFMPLTALRLALQVTGLAN